MLDKQQLLVAYNVTSKSENHNKKYGKGLPRVTSLPVLIRAVNGELVTIQFCRQQHVETYGEGSQQIVVKPTTLTPNCRPRTIMLYGENDIRVTISGVIHKGKVRISRLPCPSCNKGGKTKIKGKSCDPAKCVACGKERTEAQKCQKCGGKWGGKDCEEGLRRWDKKSVGAFDKLVNVKQLSVKARATKMATNKRRRLMERLAAAEAFYSS